MFAVVFLTAAGVGSCALRKSSYGPAEEAFSDAAADLVAETGRVRRHAWGAPPAHEGLQFLEVYVSFDSPPPEPIYVDSFEDTDTVGLFKGGRIYIKRGLPEAQERYVAIHEILHWAGFGAENTVSDRVAEAWQAEIESDEVPGIDDGLHWQEVAGFHRRSGTVAAAEIMTPTVGTVAFLAAATLANLQRVETSRWCLGDAYCGGDACTAPYANFPKLCGPVSSVEHAPSGGSGSGGLEDAEIAGIVVGSLLGAGLLLGIGTAVWKRTREKDGYEAVEGF